MAVVSDESEDWFERGLRDSEPDGSDGVDSRDATEDGNEATDSDAGDRGGFDGTTERTFTFDGQADLESSIPDGSDGSNDSAGSDGDSLFEEDFATALEDVDLSQFEGGADGTDDAGPAGYSDLDFGLATDDTDFDADFDADVDSDVPRIELGIDGLDRMIQGGVPKQSLLVVMGAAGTGKTTFGLQFLNHGLERDERAVYITLEETRERVLTSATEKGFPFDEYEADGRLAVVDMDPVEMVNSLSSIRNELPALVEEFGATRLVLDSVSLLEMMYQDRSQRRNEIFDFTQGLKKAGVTALLTSEASERTPYASRYGIIEYLTDAVFVLQYVRPDDFRETRLAVEIQKIRDANHSREKKPYEITEDGISVYQQANLF
ncbi:KaiC domain-containing protein [Natrialbaceae archaeon GCM10025810]|uniref:KaiC domain-containing protein n=1 Tax=Halovalidus salilacus TaxID=3075124 RepID=UPI00361A01BA